MSKFTLKFEGIGEVEFEGFILHDFTRDLPISLGARFTYGRLCDLAGDKGQCDPSHATLAGMIGKSVTSIKRYLRELVKAGLIKIEPASSELRTCTYIILPVDGAKSDVSQN